MAKFEIFINDVFTVFSRFNIKSLLMKKLIFYMTGFLFFGLLLSSCLNNKNSFIYNTYLGTQSILNTDGSVKSSDITIRINHKNIFINEVMAEYEVITDSDGYLLIETKNKRNDSIIIQRFKYVKDSGVLILTGKNESENILLITEKMLLERKLQSFTPFTLKADLKNFSNNEKELLKILFQVADIMDEIFWQEAYGNRDELIGTTQDSVLRELFKINYGPWDRVNNNKPFRPVYGEKFAGANFYPSDITKEEFEAFNDTLKKSGYSIISRDQDGKLYSIPYHIAFAKSIEKASVLLREAAELSEDQDFKDYLFKRATALETDEYFESDVAWMKMTNNSIDFIVGPIENYEDELFNYKSAHEAYILIKDTIWSKKLNHLGKLLPALQKGLPVQEKFKSEIPAVNSDIFVYDALYYAGDCNSGSKTIAINLPNDPEVRRIYGSRKLQLKNSMRAKFENILVPISNVLIAENQRQFIDFESFFENTMCHELAHGLGVDYTVNSQGTVRDALKESYSAIEECKADIMGLYLVTKFSEMGEIDSKNLITNYVTFLAGTFRSIRFGASNAHGIANMITYNFLENAGTFNRDESSMTYRVDMNKMKESIIDLMQIIITIQATGNYEQAKELINDNNLIQSQLQIDLNKLNAINIPVDLIFNQGPEKSGL